MYCNCKSVVAKCIVVGMPNKTQSLVIDRLGHDTYAQTKPRHKYIAFKISIEHDKWVCSLIIDI